MKAGIEIERANLQAAGEQRKEAEERRSYESSRSRQRIEMIGRVFCETGLRKLYKKLLRLVTKHQQPGKIVKLRNKYVQIDPRQWDAAMDVRVNMPIGAGTTQERLELVGGIATKQQELLTAGSPLVSNVEVRNSLEDMTLLAGKKNTSRYFKPWGEQEEMARQQQMAQQPPPMDPNMALVEVEKMKAMADMEIQQQKLALAQWEARQADDREREKISRDFQIKQEEITAKYGVQIEEARLNAEVERDRNAMDAEVKRETAMNPGVASA